MPSAKQDEIFASVVFPLADLRSLLCPEVGVINKPFRKRDTDAYLRRFGPGKYRSGQSETIWRWPALSADESWFISARRFLSVPNAPVPPRLFADGFLSARLEVPLILARSTIGKSVGNVTEWARDLLNLQVQLRSSREGKRSPVRRRTPLGEVSGHFRDAYLAATTPEPARQQARNPESEAAHQMRTAREAVRGLEPLILLVLPPSRSTGPGLKLRVGVVRTGSASFRLMTLYPDSATDMALIRLARRAFTRLRVEGRAILELTERWDSARPSTQPPQQLVKRLEALANRLFDANGALTDSQGEILPLLGELGPIVADASERLGGWLDEVYPDAGRSQRRFAKQLLRAAPHVSKVEVKMGDIFSDIRNSTIVNKSIVKEAFNKVRSGVNEDVAKMLLRVAETVSQSGNKEAGEILDQFNEELSKQDPRKSLLKRSWDNLVAVLPSVAEIAGAAAAIAKLWE